MWLCSPSTCLLCENWWGGGDLVSLTLSRPCLQAVGGRDERRRPQDQAGRRQHQGDLARGTIKSSELGGHLPFMCLHSVAHGESPGNARSRIWGGAGRQQRQGIRVQVEGAASTLPRATSQLRWQLPSALHHMLLRALIGAFSAEDTAFALCFHCLRGPTQQTTAVNPEAIPPPSAIATRPALEKSRRRRRRPWTRASETR